LASSHRSISATTFVWLLAVASSRAVWLKVLSSYGKVAADNAPARVGRGTGGRPPSAGLCNCSAPKQQISPRR
jgi:hypothetical protein